MPQRISKVIVILFCLLFIFEQSGFAQVAAQLDIASHLSTLRNALVQDKFRPLHLRYLQYNPQEHNFRLLLDKGDTKDPKPEVIEDASKQLLKYFLIGLSLPNDAFWVNLRPDSPDNIIDANLAQTDIGRIMLETDLQLKKDTASFTSPQTPEGREYWDKLYKKAEELFGYENITIPTLTRPWIVPGEIIIRESTDSAYIYKATLKVMLEQDYLKDSVTYKFDDPRLKALNEYSSQLIRELIIPKLTKEVNTSKRYAPLRQVYYSLILAQWFKARFVNKNTGYSNLIDRKILTNLTSKQDWSKTTYFQSYQQSFKDGEYNIKEPIYTPYGQSVRSYFSGGEIMTSTDLDLALTSPTAKAGNVMVEPAVNDFDAGNKPILAEIKAQATDNLGEFKIVNGSAAGSGGKVNSVATSEVGNNASGGTALVRTPEEIRALILRHDLAPIEAHIALVIEIAQKNKITDAQEILKQYRNLRSKTGALEFGLLVEAISNLKLVKWVKGKLAKKEKSQAAPSTATRSEEFPVVVPSRTLPSYTKHGNGIGISPDGRIVTCGHYWKGAVKLWDVETGILRNTLTGPGYAIGLFPFAFSPDGLTIASGNHEGDIYLWDTATGRHVRTLAGDRDWVHSIALSPDGKRLASAGKDHTVHIWDTARVDHIHTLVGHSGPVRGVAFSPNGKTLASVGKDSKICLWDMATGARSHTLLGHTDEGTSVAFSPDSKILASASKDCTVRLWDIATGTLRNTLRGHAQGVYALAFSPDGRILASGSYDKTVRLWDTNTYALCYTLTGYTEGINSVIFTPDGITLASLTNGHTIRLWDLRPFLLWQPLDRLGFSTPESLVSVVSPLLTQVRTALKQPTAQDAVTLATQTLELRRAAQDWHPFMVKVLDETAGRSDENTLAFRNDIRKVWGLLNAYSLELLRIAAGDLPALVRGVTTAGQIKTLATDLLERAVVLSHQPRFVVRDADENNVGLKQLSDEQLVRAEYIPSPENPLITVTVLGGSSAAHKETLPPPSMGGEPVKLEKLQDLRERLKNNPAVVLSQAEEDQLVFGLGSTEDTPAYRIALEIANTLNVAQCQAILAKKDSLVTPAVAKILEQQKAAIDRAETLATAPVGVAMTPGQSVEPASATRTNKGGIDFRSLPIVTQAISNLSAGIGNIPLSKLNGIDLDSEWQQIERLVSSGITPSAERVKEYVQVSCLKDELSRDMDKVVACIADILRQEEESYSFTDPVLKDILVVLESRNSVKALKTVFTGIKP